MEMRVGDKNIGTMTMLNEGNHIKIDSADILPEFQGKGYGKELYMRAIEYARDQGIGEVRSGRPTSEDAARVWKSLGASSFEDQGYTRYKLDVSDWKRPPR